MQERDVLLGLNNARLNGGSSATGAVFADGGSVAAKTAAADGAAEAGAAGFAQYPFPPLLGRDGWRRRGYDSGRHCVGIWTASECGEKMAWEYNKKEFVKFCHILLRTVEYALF